MGAENEQAMAYRVIRYSPNILREEFIHVGVVLHAPGASRAGVRMLKEQEFGRLRRLHPEADFDVLRGLGTALEDELAGAGAPGVAARLERLSETLSNTVQLSPFKGVLAVQFEDELERLYEEQVRPAAKRSRLGAWLESSVAGIRAKVKEAFRSARIYDRLEHGLAVAEFTFAGDPMRLDHAYRRNGTRGFLHALPLARDAGPARSLALTIETMRKKLEKMECHAVCEDAPDAGDPKQAYIRELFGQPQIDIRLWPVAEIGKLAQRLAPELR